jgi:hypothetical protein
MSLDPSRESFDRHLMQRVVAGVLALLATPSALRDLYGLLNGGLDPLLAVFCACTSLFVALCAWFAWHGHLAASRARMKLVLRFGLVAGAVGFVIGFLGPLVWAPGANQGPLLGIFVTGPIGFVVGAALGWIQGQRLRATARP